MLKKVKLDKKLDKNSDKNPILMIVEAPGKIKKFQQYLGKDYVVAATCGHIIDLDKTKMSIDLEKCEPLYTVLDGKGQVISNLRKLYKESSDVLIGSDLDREGEMIAWSVAKELNIKHPKRIVFGDTTEKSVLESVKNPREINTNLVNAQKLRRLIDRVIGYTISPLLWKNLGSGLSAGRVQSVIVKLIIEKENEIKDFFAGTSKESHTKSFFKITSELTIENSKINMRSTLHDTKGKNISKINIGSDEDETTKITKQIELITKSELTVSDIEEKNIERKPNPPFTTSTLQQEASSKFGFGLKRTMDAAQHLYEAGHITYMRTDSVNLSDEALELIGNYVVDKYGKKYHNKTQYKSSSTNTQEAHEACRPTHVETNTLDIDEKHRIGSDEVRLYSLIWKRAIASQMTNAKLKNIITSISISKDKDHYFSSHCETVLFSGFLSVYNIEDVDIDVDNDKPSAENTSNTSNLTVGTPLIISSLQAKEEYTKPPARYNDGTLSKKIEVLGIGRPATTASFVDKIVKVGYVTKKENPGIKKKSSTYVWKKSEKKSDKKSDKKITITTSEIVLGGDKNNYSPTSVGILVNDFMIENYSDIMEYTFTAEMEKQLDDVAEGKLKWDEIFKKFYKTFSARVICDETKTKVNQRHIGNHPENGKIIVATTGKFGSMLKMIDVDNDKKYVCAPIKTPLTIENITIDDAVKIFEYPKLLGKHERKNVTLNKGKFGYYLKIGTDKVPIPQAENGIDDFDMEKALLVIGKHNEKYLWKGSDEKNKYVVLNGPHGKYINVSPKTTKLKGKNFKLPEEIDTKELTLEKVKEIIAKNKTTYKSKFKPKAKKSNKN